MDDGRVVGRHIISPPLNRPADERTVLRVLREQAPDYEPEAVPRAMALVGAGPALGSQLTSAQPR